MAILSRVRDGRAICRSRKGSDSEGRSRPIWKWTISDLVSYASKEMARSEGDRPGKLRFGGRGRENKPGVRTLRVREVWVTVSDIEAPQIEASNAAIALA